MVVYWSEGAGNSVYNVWRFRSEGAAKRFYEGLSNTSENYSSHESLIYRSKLANNFNMECGDSIFGGYECDLDARYHEFVLSFNSIIDEQMPIDQFNRIVQFIDLQMLEHLEK